MKHGELIDQKKFGDVDVMLWVISGWKEPKNNTNIEKSIIVTATRNGHHYVSGPVHYRHAYFHRTKDRPDREANAIAHAQPDGEEIRVHLIGHYDVIDYWLQCEIAAKK